MGDLEQWKHHDSTYSLERTDALSLVICRHLKQARDGSLVIWHNFSSLSASGSSCLDATLHGCLPMRGSYGLNVAIYLEWTPPTKTLASAACAK